MQRLRNKLFFYAFALVGNAMVWGMFTTLSIPRIAVPTYVARASTPVVRINYRATVGVPQRLVVPSLGIDVQIGDGQFDPNSDTWTISDDKAYFAAVSTPANDSNGTTLLYGHARDNMFAPLTRIESGAEAYVYTTNAKRFSYRFSSIREVLPTDVSVFTEQGPPMLVMQTCSGPWDSYRAMYSFSFIEVTSA